MSTETLQPWQQTIPDEILHQYALLLQHPDTRAMTHLIAFKKACLDQEYFTYLAQLLSLEVHYKVSIPVEEA